MIVGVDLCGIAMNVDDLLVAFWVYFYWIELLHVIPDTYNDVRLVEAKIRVVVDHESYRTERVGMVVRKDSLAHERRGNGDAKMFGETNQRFAGVIAHGTVSSKQDGALRSLQNLRCTRYLSWRRRGITHHIDLQWTMTRGHGHFFDIFG